MILRRSSYCGEIAISDDSEPDFFLTSVTIQSCFLLSVRPSVFLLPLRKLKPYLEFYRRVAFKCGV